MDFTEELLHYVWSNRSLLSQELYTVNGNKLCVVRPGIRNHNSGPDFTEAIINLDHLHFAGAVEMHLKSSDWFSHSHHQDPAYDNVILHVVFEHDREVFRTDGTHIPVLELKPLIPQNLIMKYKDFIESKDWIPCASRLLSVDELYKNSWLDRVLLGRLEHKSVELMALVKQQKGSWDDAFYIALARNFGFKVNAAAFECLARSLPQKLLSRCKPQARQVEALVFGQAGFLQNAYKEAYPKALQAEYQFLQHKYGLSPLEPGLWKFMRLRPANFPTIRLAQFAALINCSSHLFSKVMDLEDAAALRKLFCNLPVHSYWEDHYLFDKQTARHSVQLGRESINNLLLNTLALFLFAYGWQHQQEHYRRRALQLLDDLAPENNQVTRNYAALGLKVDSAAGSQALLELKKRFCEVKKCLSCGIGNKILNPVLP